MQSIDGLAGGQEAGQPVDWFYYVNGVEAAKGAAATNVHAGRSRLVGPPRLEPDRGRPRRRRLLPGAVPQRHRRQAAARAHRMRDRRPATPAPRSPRGCAQLGVPAAIAAIGQQRRARTRCACSSARGRACAATRRAQRDRSAGPRASGVYARFSADGTRSTLLDQDGRPVRTLRGRRGPDRRHPQRRRRARVGRHRHRRRGRASSPPARSTRPPCSDHFAVALTPAARCRCREAGAVSACGPLAALLPAHAPARCTPRAPGSGRCGGSRSPRAALLLYHPLGCSRAAARRARRGRRRRGRPPARARAAHGARSSWLPIVLVNVLVTRDGLTVFARLGDSGPSARAT